MKNRENRPDLIEQKRVSDALAQFEPDALLYAYASALERRYKSEAMQESIALKGDVLRVKLPKGYRERLDGIARSSGFFASPRHYPNLIASAIERGLQSIEKD